MAIKHWLLITSAVLAMGCAQAGPAQAAGSFAGQVTSTEEGAMEGVVVSAKKDGSTIAISVISDATGNFTFPDAKLEPGKYTLSIRAIGFELDGPKTVDVGRSRRAGCDQAQEGGQPRQPAHQRRMDGELPGHAAAEALHGPLHQLSHLRTDREVELQRR